LDDDDSEKFKHKGIGQIQPDIIFCFRSLNI
jgi:hypothetical protein